MYNVCMLPLRKSLFALMLTALLCGRAACAQSAEADIRTRLLNKELFLRGAWIEDKLKFDAAGKPEHAYKTGPFTLAGFQANEVDVSGERAQIRGVRVAITFDPSGVPHQTVLRGSSKASAPDEAVLVEIDGNGADGRYTAALNAIFATDVKEIVRSLPVYWQAAGRAWADQGIAQAPKHRLSCSETALPAPSPAAGVSTSPVLPCTDDSPVLDVDGPEKPPKLIHSANPRFDEWARRMKFSGTSEIHLIVDKQGMPDRMEIARPVGLGLDEQAVAAVSQYRFKPAMKNGEPVAVDLYVEVNFRIF